MAAALESFLLAAELIIPEENYDVILCERGITSFGPHARSTLDLSVDSAVHQMTSLPIIVDPSHATGRTYLDDPMAKA